MAKLILSMDGLVLKEIPLLKERVSIGRKAHNDIQIDNMAISGEHAAVVTILNDSFLEDLNSTNGTLVNGQPVKKHFLKDNDVIELGKYKMKYIVDPLAPNEVSPYDQTTQPPRSAPVQNVSRVADATTSASASQPAPSAPAAASAVIQLLSGSNAGHQLQLTKTLTTLGKPGQVAVIARRPNGYFLTHVEGAFPMLNGHAVDAQARHLKDHDLIEIAGVKMEFFLKQ